MSATIPVGTDPVGVSVTPDGKHVYVTNNGDGTVSVITTATGTVSATIPVGTNPVGVSITPDGKHAYVANNSTVVISGQPAEETDNTVSVIDTAMGVVSAAITVGKAPIGVTFTPRRQARLRGQQRRRHGVGDRHGDRMWCRTRSPSATTRGP